MILWEKESNILPQVKNLMVAKENGSEMLWDVKKTDPDATFVIRYDCEDKLHSFKFSDFENSVVKLTYITATDILVRQAKERFINIEEKNFWRGQGIVISQDLNSFSNFIHNFFDNDECDGNESSLNTWEILVLPFVDD